MAVGSGSRQGDSRSRQVAAAVGSKEEREVGRGSQRAANSRTHLEVGSSSRQVANGAKAGAGAGGTAGVVAVVVATKAVANRTDQALRLHSTMRRVLKKWPVASGERQQLTTHHSRLATSFLLVLLLSSCSDALVHSETRAVPGSVWDRSWKPEFAFDISDTVGQHDTYLDIRHTGSYPYSELYLFVTLKRPDGHVLLDTVQCPLSDANGRWYGEGLGFIRSERFDAHILYKYGNRFHQPGRYSITLEQAMRVEKLEGVVDVGVSVEKHTKQ